jgi:hypothetical protein
MKKQLLDIINDKLFKDTDFILLNEDDYYILYYKGTNENITGSVLNQWENIDDLLIGGKSYIKISLFQFLCHFIRFDKNIDYNTFKSLISESYEELMLKLQMMGYW